MTVEEEDDFDIYTRIHGWMWGLLILGMLLCGVSVGLYFLTSGMAFPVIGVTGIAGVVLLIVSLAGCIQVCLYKCCWRRRKARKQTDDFLDHSHLWVHRRMENSL